MAVSISRRVLAAWTRHYVRYRGRGYGSVGYQGEARADAALQLLGGRCRDGVTVYAHANGNSVPDLLDSVARHMDLGYKAVRIQCAVPGVADATA